MARAPRKAVEWAKTALIVVLAASALFLAWRTGIFSDFFTSMPLAGSVAELFGGTGGAAEIGGVTIREAARPLCIVVTDADGLRFGARFDTAERNAVYERTSSILGEALGSAAEPFEISEGEWRAALGGAGLYYEYVTPVKLSVLDAWLGSRMPDPARGIELLRVFVSFGGERSTLYYQEHGSGRFFCAYTASAAGKAQELEIYSANGAVFAYEIGVLGAEKAPYMLLMPGREHPEVRAAAIGEGQRGWAAEEALEMTLSALGLGDEASTKYLDSAGVLVCFGTHFNIRVHADGRVLYQRTDRADAGAARRLGEHELIEIAREIAADSVGAACGDAEVVFESIEAGDAEGVYSVVFGYYIAGGRIYLSDDRPAVQVSFALWEADRIEMNYRSFTFTGERVGLMQQRQALAAAGGEFMLCYADTGAEALRPFWVRT